MKKIALLAIALVACYGLSAQVDNNTIGLRFGGGNMSGAEISYQMGLNSVNRLEIDLGIGTNSNYNALGLVGIYQWVWPIKGAEGLNWFVGPGVGLTMFNGKKEIDDFFGLSIGGQIGLGYNFKFPLQLTIDTRPMFDVLADSDSFGWGIALGVRYRF